MQRDVVVMGDAIGAMRVSELPTGFTGGDAGRDAELRAEALDHGGDRIGAVGCDRDRRGLAPGFACGRGARFRFPI